MGNYIPDDYKVTECNPQEIAQPYCKTCMAYNPNLKEKSICPAYGNVFYNSHYTHD